MTALSDLKFITALHTKKVEQLSHLEATSDFKTLSDVFLAASIRANISNLALLMTRLEPYAEPPLTKPLPAGQQTAKAAEYEAIQCQANQGRGSIYAQNDPKYAIFNSVTRWRIKEGCFV